jgi:hypothetical protein
MPDQHDEHHVVLIRELREPSERRRDLLFGGFPSRPLGVLIGLLGQIDDAFARHPQPAGCRIDQRRCPALKQLAVLRLAGQADDHREVHVLRGSRHGGEQGGDEQASDAVQHDLILCQARIQMVVNGQP